MTYSNSRVSGRSFGEGPLWMVYQKPEALSRTATHCSGHLQGIANKRGVKWVFLFSWRADVEGLGNEWGWGARREIPNQ